MDRTLGYASGAGILAMLVGLGALYGAASHWSTFGDWWLAGPSIAALVAVVMVAESVTKRRHGAEAWPLPTAKRVPYLVLSMALGAASAYLAYWVVTLGWAPEQATDGAVALLFHPERFVTIQETGHGSSSTALGLVGHVSILTGVGLVLPALWLRRNS